MTSKHQFVLIIAFIAIIMSITAYFIYNKGVLNENKKSFETKLFEQAEIIKKHEVILQTLLSSNKSKTFDKNYDSSSSNNDHDKDYNFDIEENKNVENNIKKTSQENMAMGRVLITLGDCNVPAFELNSFLSHSNDQSNNTSDKVKEIENEEDELNDSKKLTENEILDLEILEEIQELA